MILLYHHIKPESDEKIAVSLRTFTKHMLSLQDKTVVYLEDYNPLDENQAVITFDDGYKSLLNYALPVLEYFKYPFEIFLVADFFDQAQNGSSFFLNEDDLKRLMKAGGRLQYHTRSHPHLEMIDDETELEKEIVPPEYMKKLDKNGFTFLAYPYCTYSDKVIETAKKYYTGARSGKGLDKGTIYTLGSVFMEEDTKLADDKDNFLSKKADSICGNIAEKKKIKAFFAYILQIFVSFFFR